MNENFGRVPPLESNEENQESGEVIQESGEFAAEGFEAPQECLRGFGILRRVQGSNPCLRTGAHLNARIISSNPPKRM